MNNWQVESLRFTLFRVKPIETVLPLWQTLTGEKPYKIDSQPRANILTEQGTIVLGTLTHASDPLRVNWILSPSEERQMGLSLPAIGPLRESKDQFIKMMNGWLSSAAVPETNRIALGSVSMINKDNKESAYKLLSTFLPRVQIDIENSADFLYQVNRPIQSTVEKGLNINRLSKWSAVRVTGFGLSLGEKAEVFQSSREDVAARLELDINTHQSHKTPFPKEELIPLLQELSNLVDQISAEGDR